METTNGVASDDAYLTLVKKFRLAPILDHCQLEQAQKIADELTERTNLCEDENQYFHVLVDLITQFEDKTVAPPDFEPVDLLKYLMKNNDLKAIDLIEIFGSRSIASTVLSGQRELSKMHIIKLAEYFRVSPAAFFARPKSDPNAWRQYVKAFESAMSSRQFSKAQEIAEKALEEAQKFGSQNTRVCTALTQLARVHVRQGVFEDAEKLYERALQLTENNLPILDSKTESIIIELASIKKQRGEFTGALNLYERALKAKSEMVGASHPAIAEILERTAEIHCLNGEIDKGAELFRKALAIRETTSGLEYLQMISTLTQLALVHSLRGEPDDAARAYAKAIQIGGGIPDFADTSTDNVLVDLATCYGNSGDLEKALEMSNRALSAKSLRLGPKHPGVAVSLKQIASFLSLQGKQDKADELLARALQIETAALVYESSFAPPDSSKAARIAAPAKKTSSGVKLNPEAFAPQLYAIGAQVADSEEFQKHFVQFIGAVVADPFQLVHFRKTLINGHQKVLKTVDKNAPKSLAYTKIFWCSVSLATDEYFANKAREHNWSSSVEEELKGSWYELIGPAFIPSSANRRIDISVIRSFIKRYLDMTKS